MKTSELTKELLIESGINVYIENDDIVITQAKPSDTFIRTRCGKTQTCKNNYEWDFIRPHHELTRPHKYGKPITYKFVVLKTNKERSSTPYPVHVISYVWFKGKIDDGCDVDHIDGNHLNNLPNNLQILTRKENLNKRVGCKNQYDCINFEKFGEEYFELKDEWREYNRHHKYLNFENWYNKFIGG